ncbi:uncharacterized protein LOC113500043 isoform X1 [Trichoplusia ni]|uniref:Uncharacterized protein LOC113500043 isoform X1 n=1 Tax=Trichoplusia ni TaxID=7111 RepID=A0A7E5W7M1_TRINI|nr:uncharacterized protein LOC113500043 isoform X1 [Trichoplusia ni]
MTEAQPPLILCMENAAGEDVALKIEPDDNFQTFLDKAKSLLGFDVDLNSITRNQPVSLADNVYQFLITAEQNLQQDELAQNFDQMLDPNDGANDLVYILDDGTQIRASQIHFDNDDPLIDLTAEKIPFVKYADDVTDDLDVENVNIQETKKINIVESPVSRWSSKNSSPKCSFVNSLPFKLVCNNTSGFEAQFTKYLEANTAKTYATLNPVTARNKSPKSLIKDNFKNYDESYQRSDNLSYTREDILNMFKDSPMTSLPYDQGYGERRHVRKTDPSRLVHKNWNKPISYVDIDGTLIGESESQICFICGKHVDNSVDKLYLFDNEDQRLHRCSPQKKMSTQLKIICECCLNENFKPCRMKSANQFLNPDEFLVIRNNQQYIFQKIKNFSFTHLGKAKEIINKIESKVTDKEEFVKVEIGSDGEIITKPIDNDPRSDDVIIVKDEKKDGSSSDVEIIEPEPEIDNIIDNLEEADEEVKEFLGKYQCDSSEVTELKCRFCEKIFAELTEVTEHSETHKHELEDGEVYPCPLCNYGYANLKWLKGHLKAAHEKSETSNKEDDQIKEEDKGDSQTSPKVSSPIAKRTRSSSKKDGDRKDEKPSDEIKSDLNPEEAEPPVIKTEVKQECVDSSEDEIWIVQTADAEATQELQKLIDAAKVTGEGQEESTKTHKCFNCSQIFPSAEGLSNHRCRRRGRKRKSKDLVNLICIPTEEDFLKRAQGRPRQIDTSTDNDLLVLRPRKRRSREPTSNPQVVTCHNCNESFTSKVRLKFHMQFHDTTSLLAADGRYTCSECDGAIFSTETELFDHVHFQHDKQKQWQCPVDGCGKTFFLRATLTKHSRTHTDTRRYVCVTCGKRFLDKQTLDEHGVTHLQIKPFQCHICLKQLTRRSRLRMHVRAHEEELSPSLVRVCAVCARAFRDHPHAQVPTSYTHMHEEELSPSLVRVCAVCARAFRDHPHAQVPTSYTHMHEEELSPSLVRVCAVCARAFRDHPHAQVPTSYTHMHEEELSPSLVRVCAVCARAFRDHPHAQVPTSYTHMHEEELSPSLVRVCAVCARAFRDHPHAQVPTSYTHMHEEELSPSLVRVCAVCARAFRDHPHAQVPTSYTHMHEEELSPSLVRVCAVCARAFRDHPHAQVPTSYTHMHEEELSPSLVRVCAVCARAFRDHPHAQVPTSYTHMHEEELSPSLVRVCAVCARAFRDHPHAQVPTSYTHMHEEELSPSLVRVCAVCARAFRDHPHAQVPTSYTHMHEEELSPSLVRVCAVCARAFRDHPHAQVPTSYTHMHEEELSPSLVRVCAVCARAFRDHPHAQEHASKSTECIEAFANELKEEAEEVTVQLSPTSGLVRHTVQIVESPKLSMPIKRQVSPEVGEPLLSQLADEARALIRVVEIEKAFRCEYCEDVFYLESGLNAHRAIHKGVKNPFTCHICKVSFATYSRCTTHKTTHGFYKRSLADTKKQAGAPTRILGYGDFPVVKHFLCEDCGRSYLHWTYLQVHRRMKHANENFLYKCNQCDLTFPNSWSLAYHRKKIHGKTGPDDPGSTSKIMRDDYRIPCRDCDEVLPNKTALYKHRKKEHSDGAARVKKQGEDSGTGGACSRCHATFTHASDLHKHVKEVHKQETEASCTSCLTLDYRVPPSQPLGNPAQAGQARRPHLCPVCGHAFRTLSMRNEHLRVHTGERPFPCDVCGVAFRRSTAMRNHRLIHTGVRAWACGRCPKRFRIRSDLRTHLRLKHPATILVIEMEGMNPTSDEVMKTLELHNVPHDKLIEVTKMSFAKGTASVIPCSARALAALGSVARDSVACGKPAPPRMCMCSLYL